ncbi:MAG: triose-phosphate isomerase [Gammaproteobacteria bacterium]|nr:triose-phosphate isomerase [Gammaproteobacteria bacterium]
MTADMLVAGNWKMNGTRASVDALTSALTARDIHACEVMVAPPALFVPQVTAAVRTALGVGVQNVSEFDAGAYTGEMSCAMALEFGCTYALVGHSERRALFGETDVQVAAKFAACKQAGLTPVLCVGEKLAEREAGETDAVVARQVQAVLDACGADAFADSVVAYEPVWAIGTGKTATPEQAQAVHAGLRALVRGVNPDAAVALRILYGGSVNAGNAAELFAGEDIDGALVGGAALDAEAFETICVAADAEMAR